MRFLRFLVLVLAAFFSAVPCFAQSAIDFTQQLTSFDGTVLLTDPDASGKREPVTLYMVTVHCLNVPLDVDNRQSGIPDGHRLVNFVQQEERFELSAYIYSHKTAAELSYQQIALIVDRLKLDTSLGGVVRAAAHKVLDPKGYADDLKQ